MPLYSAQRVRRCRRGAVSHINYPFPNLSPRHAELAELIASGLTNTEIAAHFDVHIRVIGAHIETVLRILGLHARAALVEWVTRHSPVGRVDQSSEATPAWYSPLTQKEAQVAERVAAGLNSHEVAVRLGLSDRQSEGPDRPHCLEIGKAGIQIGRRRQIGEWVAAHRPATDPGDKARALF